MYDILIALHPAGGFGFDVSPGTHKEPALDWTRFNNMFDTLESARSHMEKMGLEPYSISFHQNLRDAVEEGRRGAVLTRATENAAAQLETLRDLYNNCRACGETTKKEAGAVFIQRGGWMHRSCWEDALDALKDASS